MVIDDVLDLPNVHVGLRATDKARLLADLARLSAPSVPVAAADIESALSAREILGSTGLGDGLALPHARLRGIDRAFGLFCILKVPIAFDAVDDEPVDLVFLLLLPTGSTGTHLGALAAATRKLRDPQVAAGLRRARDPLEAFTLLTGAR